MIRTKVVLLECPPELKLRYAKNLRAKLWNQKSEINRGPGYIYPCWVCKEEGVLAVDIHGFGEVRPRNMMHKECYEGLSDEQRAINRHRDTKHVFHRMMRRQSKKSRIREKLRERKYL